MKFRSFNNSNSIFLIYITISMLTASSITRRVLLISIELSKSNSIISILIIVVLLNTDTLSEINFNYVL